MNACQNQLLHQLHTFTSAVFNKASQTLAFRHIEPNPARRYECWAILSVAKYWLDAKNILNQPPSVQSFYCPGFEKDNCGFGLIAQMDNQPSDWLAQTTIGALARLIHRSAVATDG